MSGDKLSYVIDCLESQLRELIATLHHPQPEAVIWSPAEVFNLNEFQSSGVMHPFTCPNRGDDSHKGGGELVATRAGWICPYCDYTQKWAHDFMLTGDAVDLHKKATALSAYRSAKE